LYIISGGTKNNPFKIKPDVGTDTNLGKTSDNGISSSSVKLSTPLNLQVIPLSDKTESQQ